MRPSLPQVVVLPEPCRPHIISTVTSSVPEVERVIDRAHQVDQFLIDDADDLLAGVERLEHLLADGLLGDARHEVADDREADVGFEQRLLDELQPVAHVRFGQLALAAERLEGGTQAFLEGFEHGSREQGARSRELAASQRLAGNR